MQDNFVAFLGITFFVVFMMIGFPVMWMDGHAKSEYLKQAQGINLPWYEAIFIDVSGNNISATIQQKKESK